MRHHERGSVNIPNGRCALLNVNSLRWSAARFAIVSVLTFLFASVPLPSQTVGTGSIVGIVTDPQGAVVAGAKVAITNRATSAVINVTTSSVGSCTSGPIVPGDYLIQIEAKGFNMLEH